MAKYKIIPSSRTIVQSPISIGHKAEKGVEAIEFDLTAWVETYGSGTLTVIMRRWGDAIPYPIALEIDENNKATWTLSDTDTAKAGMAYAQLSYIVGDEVVKKSDIYTFRVMDSLTGEGEPPEAYESWLEHLQHLAAEAMAEVLDIEGVVTDKTLTVDGGIADAKATGDALSALEDAVTEKTDKLKADLDAIEPGLSDAAKAALLNCFNHVSWKNGVGMEYFNELEEALGSAIRIDTSELKQGGFSNTYPYFVSNQNRLVYVGTKIETTPGCQYRVEFKNNTTDSIDVGVYAFDGSTLEKVQNQETISVASGDNQGWQLSNYTFIAGDGQKLVWISFRKNAGDVPIIASDISDVKISRIGKPGIMTASYQEILVSERYSANHTSSMSVGLGLNVYRNIDGEINYQNCPVNKIKLKALSTGVITIGKIKKSDAVEGNPGDMSLAHRKVTVQITQTGEQEVEFEGFPVADDEYVCMGFNSWDDSDKTKTTANWTYGKGSADVGYMYMQVAEPHKWVFWTGGTSNGINLYIRKRVYS